MRLLRLAGAFALLAVGLSACNDGGRMVNSQICTDFKATTGAQAPAAPGGIIDAATPVDECVRRWAYSLAGARDSADVVANAAVAACGAQLSRWNQAGLNQPAQAGGGQVEALSLATGEPTNPLAEHNAFANGRALLYVVQARAGRCAPPPATNGVPTGL